MKASYRVKGYWELADRLFTGDLNEAGGSESAGEGRAPIDLNT